MDSTSNSTTLVCKLTGVELTQRLNELKLEVFAKVSHIREANNGFVFHFKGDDDFVLKLTDYILTERKCCPFFRFDLTFQPNDGDIQLEISGPAEAKEMVAMFIKEIGK